MMYFFKVEFTPKDEANDVAKREAEEIIQIASKRYGVMLDGTAGSIKQVDEILDRIYRAATRRFLPLAKEKAAALGRKFGTYFGEALRQEFGGDWGVTRVFSDNVISLSVGPTAISVNPWMWAAERAVTGEGKTLFEWCEVVARSIRAASSPTGSEIIDGQCRQLAATPDRLYKIREDQGYFEAGTTADGRQVLMAFMWSGLTVVYFDSEGRLLGNEVRPLPAAPAYNEISGMAMETPEFSAAVERALSSWREEIGFQPTPINVHRFSVPELGFGIEDRPDYHERFLKAPELEEPDEEERRERFEDIREWDKEGKFVLYWGNDLFMSADGEVESS